ncbi:hypothetical protein Leryth_012459 [Lithospermum erythrorhizon]|nr:hypothetical protein Leryth_012459 [Lithospermum erythrorhizon]
MGFNFCWLLNRKLSTSSTLLEPISSSNLSRPKTKLQRILPSSELRWKLSFRGSWKRFLLFLEHNVKRLEKETDEKIQQLKIQAADISHEVVQMLLKYVTTVNK